MNQRPKSTAPSLAGGHTGPLTDMGDELEAQAYETIAQGYAMLAQAKRLQGQRHRKEAVGDNLLTVPQFCAKYDWCKVGGLRYAIFHGVTNGFESCVVRFGRRLLIDEAKVMEWIRDRGMSRGSLRRRKSVALP